MNIAAASQAAGLPTKTVRYYADIDLVTPTARSKAGYRLYDEAAIKKLIFVRRSRAFGFTIEACRELLTLYQDQDRTSADVKRLATQRLQEIEFKQKELQSLHDELSHLIKACRGDSRPDCPIINYLS